MKRTSDGSWRPRKPNFDDVLSETDSHKKVQAVRSAVSRNNSSTNFCSQFPTPVDKSSKDLLVASKLLSVSDELEKTSDHKQKLRLRGQVLSHVRTLVELRYDTILRECARTSVCMDDHRDQLTWTVQCMAAAHKVQPLNKELVKWVMVKLLLSRTSQMVEDKLGGFLQEKIMLVARFLNANDAGEFFRHLIDQCTSLVRNTSNHIQFYGGDKEAVSDQYRVSVPACEVTGGKKIIFIAILDLFLHGSFDYSTLEALYRFKLWGIMYELASSTPISPKIVNTCVLLMSRLVSLGLCCDVTARLYIDILLSLESQLLLYHPKQKDLALEADNLRESVGDGLKTFSKHILNEDSPHLYSLTVELLIEWALRAVTLSIAKVERTEHIADVDRLFGVVCASQRLLCMVDDDIFFSTPLAIELADKTKPIIERLIRSRPSSEQSEQINELKSAFGFLVHVDSICQTEKNLFWIEQVCNKICAEFDALKKFEEAIGVRRVVAYVLNGTGPEGKDVLKKVIPDPCVMNQWIEIASKLPAASGSSLLIELFRLISDLVDEVDDEQTQSPALAFLSIPWLTKIDLTLDPRHKKHIPMLKDMNVLAKVCKRQLTPEVFLFTLPALARTTGFSEWRRTIFMAALTSSDKRLETAALENFAELISTVDPSCHPMLFKAIIDLVSKTDVNTNTELACSVMNALGKSICVAETSSKFDFSTKSIDCVACRGFAHSGTKLTQGVEIPPELISFLISVFKNEQLPGHGTQLKHEACQLLFCVLSHSNGRGERFPELHLASLSAMQNMDDQVRAEFLCSFKAIISSCPLSAVVEETRKIFQKIRDIDNEEEKRTKIREFAPFFSAAAIGCPIQNFSTFCMVELTMHWIRTSHDCDYIKECILSIIKSKTEKEGLGDTKRLFSRNCRAFCQPLAEELGVAVFMSRSFDHGNDANSMESADSSREDVDTILDNIGHLFGFQTLKQFLQASSSHLVPYLLMRCDTNTYYKEDLFVVLDYIRSTLNYSRTDMMMVILPSLIEKTYHYDFPPLSKSRLRNAFREYSSVEMDSVLQNRRYFIVYYLIRNLSLNETTILRKLGGFLQGEPCAAGMVLTEIMKYNCEYLGFLLNLRRHLLDDEHFELRSIFLSSLCVIIRSLNAEFLDDISNKMLIVLRAATSLGEQTVDLWTEFVKHLGTSQLANLLPQILIAIQPLFVHDSSEKILSVIFKDRRPLSKDCVSDAFNRTALVLSWDGNEETSRLSRYLNDYTEGDTTNVIEACVKMLHEECDVVGKVVLQRLLSILDGEPLEDSLAAQLVPALLHSIRSCSSRELRLLASRCLGRVGAVDPGRVGLSSSHRMQNRVDQEIVFVDAKNGLFYLDLLERCWKVYTSIVDAELIYNVEYSIQLLLGKLVKTRADEHNLMQRLKGDCRKDIEPLLNTRLSPQNDLRKAMSQTQRPILRHVDDFFEWLLQCFIIGVHQVKQTPYCDVFRALKWIGFARDTDFLRNVLPQLIIQLIIEKNKTLIDEYFREMEECLRAAVNDSGWVRMTAHVVFSILDTLECYTVHRRQMKRKDDAILDATLHLINRLVTIKLDNNTVLVVAAAEKCGCLLRALRWCEQFAIEKDSHGEDLFNRTSYYTLERVYTSLQDIDGVLGAYECIAKETTPTDDERVLALEATGDYTDAMPLYEQTSEHKELKLIKCLLRLNQPQLALTSAEQLYQRYSEGSEDANALTAVEDAQIEAAWHLRSWNKLDQLVEKCNPARLTRETSWGASCASILNSLRLKKGIEVERNIETTRERLVERLMAMTIEDSDAYAQAYKYIAKLHILEEIDEFRHPILRYGSPRSEARVLAKWQNRSDLVVQCASVLEPMLRVRRELISSSSENCEPHVCQLLLQSCRLARQAGHLQIAWTFLVEAKSLKVCEQEVGMEEARFQFQKGAGPDAISLLAKMLSSPDFATLNTIFRSLCDKKDETSRNRYIRHIQTHHTKEQRTQFAEIQLLNVQYMQMAGTMSANDLYSIYNGLRSLDVKSEDLYYRVAVFFDFIHDSNSERLQQGMQAVLAQGVLSTYMEVLKNGKSHLFHVMPRMLTIWLDITEKLNGQVECASGDAEVRKKLESEIDILNECMDSARRELDPFMFFTAFPQLISRIGHPNESTFQLLKEILVSQLHQYPHQCLWQSIAVYRAKPSEGMLDKQMTAARLRKERMAQVYDATARNNAEIRDLIDQYDYVSKLLIEFGQCKIKPGQFKDLQKKFPDLFQFFEDGRINTNMLTRNKHKSKTIKCKPKVMLPLTELMEKALPKTTEQKLTSFTQMRFDEDSVPVEQHTDSSDVLIQSIKQDYLVMASLQRPKKFTLIGQDGQEYSLMAKSGDEMRKDARFNDVNRMMNCMMRRNADARRRQLMTKTFTVIPLESHGGILEWVPNVSTYRSILNPLFDEKVEKRINDTEWRKFWPEGALLNTRKQRTDAYRDILCPAHPLVMAEWFRRSFPDPSSWHAARVGYARSAAVMSMIGFVMGLGDRHTDNILVDIRDGCVMHVDYNLIFNKGETLPVPEVVPFRLTRNMLNGLGPTGVEGAFRKSAEATLRVMRENKETLLTVIGTFVYDPLVEFINKDNKAQQTKYADPRSSESSSPYSYSAKESVQLIGMRLNGHIVTKKDMMRISMTSAPMCIEGQVNKLIEMATDERLLIDMFIGWAAFI